MSILVNWNLNTNQQITATLDNTQIYNYAIANTNSGITATSVTSFNMTWQNFVNMVAAIENFPITQINYVQLSYNPSNQSIVMIFGTSTQPITITGNNTIIYPSGMPNLTAQTPLTITFGIGSAPVPIPPPPSPTPYIPGIPNIPIALTTTPTTSTPTTSTSTTSTSTTSKNNVVEKFSGSSTAKTIFIVIVVILLILLIWHLWRKHTAKKQITLAV